MAYIMNFYRDWMLTQVEKQIVPGVAAFIGDAANLSTWLIALNGPPGYTEKKIYMTMGLNINAGNSTVILSGGAEMYNNNVPELRPDRETVPYDRITESPVSENIYNPLFIGAYIHPINNLRYGVSTSIVCENPQTSPFSLMCSLTVYRQTPDDATGDERTSWSYGTSTWFPRRTGRGDSTHAQTKIYKTTIQENDYFCIVVGVSSTGEYIDSSLFYLIPADFFEDKELQPWTGQETESNSENAYTPTTPYRGSILPRDLTNKRNPYGFNSGNGLTLAVITFEEYAAILQGIYAGTAESVLNKLSQGWATIVGGNTHRPADEVQAITSAILACHMIPQLTGYVSGSMTLRTIAGYHILGGNASEAVTLSLWTTQNTIFEFETSTYYIQRRLNSFLDFEPYTTIILHLPLMPTIDIKPSILYGNGLKIHYKIDIFTGVLSADIMIVDSGGTSQDIPREFILTTLQTNVKTDIPIMGNAAQSGMFSSLTNALVSSVGAESYSGLIAGGIGAADMFSKMSTGQAVGQSKIDGIGAYLSNRQPYLIITRPNPANPPNYNQLAGIPSHMGGKVGDYFRANNADILHYTEFAVVDLSGIPATDQEKAEIENLLKSGVII